MHPRLGGAAASSSSSSSQDLKREAVQKLLEASRVLVGLNPVALEAVRMNDTAVLRTCEARVRMC
jgi:hypothetical protein